MDNKKKPAQKRNINTKKTSKKPTKRISKKTNDERNSKLKFSTIVMILMLIVIVLLCIYIYLLKTTKITIPNNATSNKTISNITLNNTTNVSQNNTAIMTKPRLVIIIDDVVSKAQINNINNISLNLTPSFLPPTKTSPSSAKNRKFANFYMVHLPLEALSFHDEQDINRLYVNDTYKEIYNKLAKFKQEFPDTIFYNGHTGSKFTSDEKAMDKLFSAMNELGLVYVESKTISNVASEKLAEKYSQKLLVRDVFLDHEVTDKFVMKQLNLAIKIAKKNGYAIAIGHPHEETLRVLKNSVEMIKNEVDVVYLKDLYYAEN